MESKVKCILLLILVTISGCISTGASSSKMPLNFAANNSYKKKPYNALIVIGQMKGSLKFEKDTRAYEGYRHQYLLGEKVVHNGEGFYCYIGLDNNAGFSYNVWSGNPWNWHNWSKSFYSNFFNHTEIKDTHDFSETQSYDLIIFMRPLAIEQNPPSISCNGKGFKNLKVSFDKKRGVYAEPIKLVYSLGLEVYDKSLTILLDRNITAEAVIAFDQPADINMHHKKLKKYEDAQVQIVKGIYDQIAFALNELEI